MNKRQLKRQDLAAIAMNAIELDTFLAARTEMIVKLEEEKRELLKAIDSVNNISGRASAGHDAECECSYCIIHKIAFKVWKKA